MVLELSAWPGDALRDEQMRALSCDWILAQQLVLLRVPRELHGLFAARRHVHRLRGRLQPQLLELLRVRLQEQRVLRRRLLDLQALLFELRAMQEDRDELHQLRIGHCAVQLEQHLQPLRTGPPGLR